MSSDVWCAGRYRITLDRPRIMGILNVTPDSFSDGGRFRSLEPALVRARAMVSDGADLIDVGGESTRPGAPAVSAAEEADRVLPVLERLIGSVDVALSVDTRKAEIAREALSLGVDVVNDVSALAGEGMTSFVAASTAGVVLMHMRGTPETMQSLAHYGDVVEDVADELAAAVAAAVSGGISPDRIAVDPGIGFAKTAEHNLEILARLGRIAQLGHPVLVGPSRKAFIGAIAGGVPPQERDAGTAAACVMAGLRGARIFRVHDVRGVRQALDVAEAISRFALPET